MNPTLSRLIRQSSLAAIPILFLAFTGRAAISGERPVSPPAYGPPQGYRSNAVSASDGRDFLVVWMDSLRNRSSETHIYAARVGPTGEVLDPFGILLPSKSQGVSSVSVVYDGTSYLVLWNEFDSLVRLVGVRVSRDGVLLDPSPRVLAVQAQNLPAGAASNGQRTVIVYRATNGILMRVVLDRDANIVAGPGALAGPTGLASEAAMIASNGRDFLVLHASTRATHVTLLDADGATGTTSAVLAATPALTLYDLASDGDSYVAITGHSGTVRAQHFGTAGEVLEDSVIPLQQIYPAFVFASGGYLLMDGDPFANTLGVRKLDRTGKPLGDYVPIRSASSFTASGTLSSNGTDVFAGWVEWAAAGQLFNESIINGQSLAASTPKPVILAARTQTSPAAASSGANMAVVWNQNDGLYAARMSNDGAMLDGAGIRVGGGSVTPPAIVFDGANYVIGWTEQLASAPAVTLVKLTRLSPGSGALLDPDGVTIAQNFCGSGLALASGGTTALLAWSDCQHLFATTVGKDLSSGAPVSVAPANAMSAAISAAWNGREWLLAWENLVPAAIFFEGPAYELRINAARLSPSLALLDPAPIVLSNVSSSHPLAASDGNDFLVAWMDYRGPSGNVRAQRVSSDGSLLGQPDGVPLGSGYIKSIVWDGSQFDVAFSSATAPYTLYVTHVAPRGAIESREPLAVISDRGIPDASLMATGAGSVVAAYTRIEPKREYGDVERVFVGAPHPIRARAAGR